MARYIFEFANSEADVVVVNFANDGAAIQEACLRASNGSAHQLPAHRNANYIVVKNDDGRVVHQAKIR